VFPLAMIFYAHDLPKSLSPTTLNYCWLIMFLIDYCYKSTAGITKSQLPMKYYWQIKWIEIQVNPTPLLSRLLLCGLLILLVDYVQSELETIALVNIQIAFCYLISLLIGSFQFDNEKFYLTYRFYLANTLLSLKSRYLLDTLPAILVSFLIAIILNKFLYFSLWSAISLPIGTAITLLSVTKYKRNFFIIPSLFFILFFTFT
jgi:hypothetical protein